MTTVWVTVSCLLTALCIIEFVMLRANNSSRHALGHDQLTGLCRLDHLVEKSKGFSKDSKARYIIYIDIADFKLVNEIFGRENGNKVLITLADEIRAHAAPGMLYGRMNSDCFVMIADKQPGIEDMLRSIAQSFEQKTSKLNYRIQLYFGIYETADFDEPLTNMCDKAHIAAATVKNDTQNRIGYYEDAMMWEALRQKRIIDEFEPAMQNGEFQMYLQPQFAAGDESLIGAEALVRRIKPDGTIVPPAEFIPIYEKTGLICRIDRFIWEQAAMKLREWKLKGVDSHISVNISPHNFYYMNVYEELVGLTEKYNINPGALNVEVTETALMSDVPNLRAGMKKLREAGFIVEIDDFGSGYSSLSALKDINADILKIDMGFLRKTENTEKGRVILETVISLAKQLKMSVITEGVELAEQAEGLRRMGCDYFQGYYYSKPISVESFEKQYMPELEDDKTDTLEIA